MKANGQVYTPYTCSLFDITPSGTAATDIEHIVALAEAHDSAIADDRRRTFAADLDNLTIADPTVNRSQKSAKDAAEWKPTRHGAWFAERVIQVKLEYGLTIDPAERDALKVLLASGGAQLPRCRLTIRPPAATWPAAGLGRRSASAAAAVADLPGWPVRDGAPRRLVLPADAAGAVVYSLAPPGARLGAADAVSIDAVTAAGELAAPRLRRTYGAKIGYVFAARNRPGGAVVLAEGDPAPHLSVEVAKTIV